MYDPDGVQILQVCWQFFGSLNYGRTGDVRTDRLELKVQSISASRL